MATVLTIRVEEEMLSKLDELAAQMTKDAPWHPATRSDAVRYVLEQGISAVDTDKKQKRTK